MTSKKHKVLLSLLVLLLGLTVAEAADPILVLRTEPAPRQEEMDGAVYGLLTRELGRQAILIAARDELGMATRDETLRETAFQDVLDRVTVDWTPKIRTQWSGATKLFLEETLSSKPVREPVSIESKSLGTGNIFRELSIAWQRASRNELVAVLRAAGLEGKRLPPNPKNLPDEQIEVLLSEMNFISQYAAVSIAHRAIAEEGESVEWLSVLARGYAHLGTLVAHHWTSAPEAFFARSLLYAERASTMDPKGNEAKWLFPYALSLTGIPSMALWEHEAAGPMGEGTPAWAAVIAPYSRFELVELIAVGEGDSTLGPLTRWLAVCMQRTLGSHRAFYKVARSSLEVSPDAFGCYSNLVTVYSSLRDQRYGASMGPRALGRFPLTRLEKLDDLPEGLVDRIPKNRKEYNHLIKRLGGSLEEGPFSPTPRFVIQQLQTAELEQELPREPSWMMLASLIEEEQFVMGANYCRALQNATESSHEKEVIAMLEFIEDHRFRPFLVIQKFPYGEQAKQRDEVFADLIINDPRQRMTPMLSQAYQLTSQPKNSKADVREAYIQAARLFDYRLPSMVEAIAPSLDGWVEKVGESNRRHFAECFKFVSPHSPHWLLAEMTQPEEPDEGQLKQWALVAGKDISTCHGMARFYAKSQEIDEAIVWYERAYKVDPTDDTTIELAELLRAEGRLEQWLPTLERFLNEVESRGLEHSHVQTYIANTYMKDRNFERAVPYAEEAAQSYSGTCLACAMEANEGAANWQKADFWAKEKSRHYPSWGGTTWYLFRHRTGRGDPNEARPYLEKALAAGGKDQWPHIYIPVLENDTEEGFRRFHEMAVNTNQAYWWVMSAILAYELEDKKQLKHVLSTTRDISAGRLRKSNPEISNAILACLSPLESDEWHLNENELEELLSSLSLGGRRDYEFFLGAVLQVVDIEPDLSDRLLCKSVSTQPFDFITAHLAGHYLVRKHGVSRTDPILPGEHVTVPVVTE